MNFHPDALRLLLAILPPLTAGVLLLRRTAPVWAGLGALAAALAVLPAFDVFVADLVGPALRIGPVALEVLGIMYGGLLLFEVLRSAGLHQTLGRWVTSLAPDRPLQVLLVALGVAPFMESVTGFGVGLIMAAPILREMGLSSRQATVVAMLGIVSVPWGALGPGTLVAAELGGVDLDALGMASARYSLPVFVCCGFTALAAVEGLRGAWARAADLVLAAGSLWLGIWGANRVLGTPPAGAVGSALAACVVAVRSGWGRAGIRRPSASGPVSEPERPGAGRPGSGSDRAPLRAEGPDGAEIRRAIVPYVVLMGALLAARAAVSLAGVPDPAGRWLRSPALWLLVTAALTLCLGAGAPRGRAVLEAAAHAYRRWRGVAGATLLFLLLGTVMTHSGMAAALAAGAAGVGRAYVLAAPWIGGLGGFLTGSNTGANAMFAAAQAAAAGRLGLPVLQLVAIQNVAASLLTMVSGPRLALARSLLDEGESWQGIVLPVVAANLVVLVVWSLWMGWVS